MKEKLKVIGQGSLNGKKYGNVKIDEEIPIVFTYDKILDQFSVNGQWEIPFHRNNENMKISYSNKLKDFYYEIKNLRNYLTEIQKFESSESTRIIEKELLNVIEDLKK
jgi:hypothetical protein